MGRVGLVAPLQGVQNRAARARGERPRFKFLRDTFGHEIVFTVDVRREEILVCVWPEIADRFVEVHNPSLKGSVSFQ